jgi:hypothetical protein
VATFYLSPVAGWLCERKSTMRGCWLTLETSSYVQCSLCVVQYVHLRSWA